MLGKLDPEERVMSEPEVYSRFLELSQVSELKELFEKFGWEASDDIVVEIGGTSIYEIEGAGTKWAPVKGTRKYNKDAFIVIKNRDRNPTVSSEPFGEGEFKPAHSLIEQKSD